MNKMTLRTNLFQLYLYSIKYLEKIRVEIGLMKISIEN